MRRDVMDMDINELDRIEKLNRDKGMNYVYPQPGTGLLVGCHEKPNNPNAKPIGEFFADLRKRMLERGNVTA